MSQDSILELLLSTVNPLVISSNLFALNMQATIGLYFNLNLSLWILNLQIQLTTWYHHKDIQKALRHLTLYVYVSKIDFLKPLSKSTNLIISSFHKWQSHSSSKPKLWSHLWLFYFMHTFHIWFFSMPLSSIYIWNLPTFYHLHCYHPESSYHHHLAWISYVCLLNHIRLCDPVNCPPGSSMGLSQQEYWSGLPFPPPGDLPDPGIEPAAPALAGRFFTTWELNSSLLTSLPTSAFASLSLFSIQ